jgi:hypothetical protein
MLMKNAPSGAFFIAGDVCRCRDAAQVVREPTVITGECLVLRCKCASTMLPECVIID